MIYKNKKIAILLSGGLESVSALYGALDIYDKEQILAITVDFGQRSIVDNEFGKSFGNNVIELQYVKRLTDRLEIDLEIIDLSYFKPVLGFMQERIGNEGNTLLGSNLSLFPARNHLMINSAIVVCEVNAITNLFLGAALTDYVKGIGNVESSDSYAKAFNDLHNISKEHNVTLRLGIPTNPSFIRTVGLLEDITSRRLSKAGEIKYLESKGVDFVNEVWTCLHPKIMHSLLEGDAYHQCGTCKSCVRNRASFISAGVHDPYMYASDDWQLDNRMLYQMELAGDDVSMFKIKVEEKSNE